MPATSRASSLEADRVVSSSRSLTTLYLATRNSLACACESQGRWKRFNGFLEAAGAACPWAGSGGVANCHVSCGPGCPLDLLSASDPLFDEPRSPTADR